jgi:hypothetical protein
MTAGKWEKRISRAKVGVGDGKQLRYLFGMWGFCALSLKLHRNSKPSKNVVLTTPSSSTLVTVTGGCLLAWFSRA